MVRDSRGFMWFGTRAGLSRFDGQEFVTYSTDEGLPDPTVNDLIETRSGEYWIATNGGGVCRFDPSAATAIRGNDDALAKRRPFCTAIRITETGPANSVNRLYEDPRGTIWAGTDGGLFRWDEETGGTSSRWVKVDLPSPTGTSLVGQVWEGPDGGQWVVADRRLLRRLPDGRIFVYEILPGTWPAVRSLGVDPGGAIWICHGDGLTSLRPHPAARLPSSASDGAPRPIDEAGEVRRYGIEDGIPEGGAVDVLFGSDGLMWVATSDGLLSFDGKRFRRYTTEHGLVSNKIFGLAEDLAGNLWMSALTAGLMKLTHRGFKTFGVADGFARIAEDARDSHSRQRIDPARVHSLQEDRSGRVIAFSGRWIVNRFDGSRFEAARPGLPAGAELTWASQAGYQDSFGEWWFATNAGLYRFSATDSLSELARGSPLAFYDERDGLPSGYLRRLFEDDDGNIWIASLAPGVTRWERATDTFRHFSAADGLPPDNQTFSIAQDLSGAIWVGLRDGGLARYVDGRFETFTAADGLPDGGIPCLFVDHAGRLWIASSQEGIARLDDPAAAAPVFVRYTTADGLSTNNLRSLTEDAQGRIYAGTVRGLDRLDPEAGYVKHYTVADGLANNFVTSSLRDRDGRLWFGTFNGLSRLEPEPERRPSPPPVWIGGLQVAGVPLAISELGAAEVSGLLLGPRRNHLRLDFFSLAFGAGESLRFQYRLEGADPDWSAPVPDRSVVYASLAPGRYRFLVRAISADGGVSETPATVAFRVLRPVWQRWWFVTLVLIAVAATAWTAHRLHVARAVELERVRTRIATDLHDDIGASLSQIAILSEVLNRRRDLESAASRTYLARIADSSRELVDSMADIVWAINPRRDRLSDLVLRMRRFVGDAVAGRDLEYTFSAPPEDRDLHLGPDLRRQLFLVCKESVNNAVRHSGCDRLTVDLHLKGEGLELRVRDNGRGFDTAAEYDGYGLDSIRRRASELGGKLRLESVPGEGTTVWIEVPLGRRKRAGTATPSPE